ncbi:hypothetical protein [Bacillus amyloliquefaciens]|uniref:hypothetical protein n=1 Tax=Bacillus amyloliquefaciens TaxID=1390 RepID=UPI00200CED51|nr:hypothetical protein [Bacillus amyloliquefaciens]UQB84344.1 hypothetical protein KMZ31_19685 [Bacillus amyloliquefaciens]
MASLMCTQCFKLPRFPYEVHRFEKYHPYEVGQCKQCGGTVCEMDELIAPTISELNKKGWITKYCCSNHLGELSTHTYILFKGSEFIPSIFPNGFWLDGDCLRFGAYKEMLEGTDGLKKLASINAELYEWALSLPAKDSVNV